MTITCFIANIDIAIIITDLSTVLSSYLDSLSPRGIYLDYNGLSIGTLNTTIAWKTNYCSSNYSVNVFTNELVEGELTQSTLKFIKSIGSDTNMITIPTNEATGRYFNISTMGEVQVNCLNPSAYYFSFQES